MYPNPAHVCRCFNLFTLHWKISVYMSFLEGQTMLICTSLIFIYFTWKMASNNSLNTPSRRSSYGTHFLKPLALWHIYIRNPLFCLSHWALILRPTLFKSGKSSAKGWNFTGYVMDRVRVEESVCFHSWCC